MSSEIIVLPEFAERVKKLGRKYRLIKKDLTELKHILSENPKAGIPLSRHYYKIRLSNSSIPTGKSGGFRIIYYYIDDNGKLYLMTIYSKTQQTTISDDMILEILKSNGLE